MDTNHKKEETQKRFSSGAGKKSCRTSSIKHNRDAVVLSPSHHMIGDHNIFISVSYLGCIHRLAQDDSHWSRKMQSLIAQDDWHWIRKMQSLRLLWWTGAKHLHFPWISDFLQTRNYPCSTLLQKGYWGWNPSSLIIHTHKNTSACSPSSSPANPNIFWPLTLCWKISILWLVYVHASAFGLYLHFTVHILLIFI